MFLFQIFGFSEYINYFCNMEQKFREIFYSEEYQAYYNALPERVKLKYDYVENIIMTLRNVNSKFVKKIENTVFYEARISVGTNEYRTITFAVDSKNFAESKIVVFLNSFLKKDTKQYRGEIIIAENILKKYLEEK